MAAITSPRASPPLLEPTHFLNAPQMKRLTEFFHERVYHYAPRGSSIHCDIPLIDFLKKYVKNLGASVKEVLIKGGLFHYVRIGECRELLSDLDFEITVHENENWVRVEQMFWDTVSPFTGGSCNFYDKRITWWSVRVLREDKGFAIYGLPTFFQESTQPIETTVKKSRMKNSCIGSGDSLRINITGWLQGTGPASITSVDGYDVQSSLELLQNHQFTIVPIERIDALINGVLAYCHILSRGSYPNDPLIEPKFIDTLFTRAHAPLSMYLDKHYLHDLEGRILYLINYYWIINRCKIEKEKREPLEAPLFELLRPLLKIDASCDHKAMRAFCLHSVYYLYLSSSERIQASEGRVLFRAARIDEARIGNDFIFAQIDTPTIHRFAKNPPISPILEQLARLFPHSADNLENFFRAHMPPTETPVDPVVPIVIVTPLKEMIGKVPMKEIALRYKEHPDPSCLEAIAAISRPTFFSLLTIDDDPSLIFPKYPQETLDFLLKAPSCFAKKYFAINPSALTEKFGAELYVDSLSNIQLSAERLPLKQLAKVYSLLEPMLLQLEEPLFLKAFLPFFQALRTDSKMRKGFERIKQMEERFILEIEEPLRERFLELRKPPPPPKLPKLKAPPPVKDFMHEALLRLPKELDETFETLFSYLIIAITENKATECLNKLQTRLSSLYTAQNLPRETRSRLYLFNVHILMFYIKYRKGQPIDEVLSLLGSVLQRGFRERILTLDILEKVNPLASKEQARTDESAAFLEEPSYWADLISVLWSRPDGCPVLREIAELIVKPFKPPDKCSFYLSLAAHSSLLDTAILIPESQYYIGKAFYQLEIGPIAIPALWKTLLDLKIQTAQQMAKKRAELSDEKFLKLQSEGIEMCKRIEAAIPKLPFAISFVDANPAEQFESLLKEVRQLVAIGKWENLQKALTHLTLAVQLLEKNKMGKMGVDALLAIWGVATGTLLHAPVQHRIPVQEWEFMRATLFELTLRARASLPTTLCIATQTTPPCEEDEKINNWLVQLITKTKSIGKSPDEFFDFIQMGRLTLGS